MRNDEQQPPQGPQAPQPYPGGPVNYQGQPSSQPPAGPPAGAFPSNPQNFPAGPFPGAPQGSPPGYVPGGQPNPPSGYLPYPVGNPPSQFPSGEDFPDLTMDMGSTMSFGQTMGFHAISIPQPSQSIPKLRQARLQQLREDRMRRQQRRLKPDGTVLGRRGDQPANRLSSLPGIQSGPLGNAAGPLAAPARSPLPGAQAQPGAVPQTPRGRVNSAPLAAATDLALAPAAEPAQDTGLIQRVKVERATSLITVAFIASSILGLVEQFLFTYVFGAGRLSDSYLQAYIIPNLIYTVVSGGALSSAFIPVFTSYATGRKDEKTAWHIASSALNLSVIGMIVLSAIAMVLAPALVPLYSPGHDVAMIVTLTRIMLLQAIVLGSGVIVSSVLNAKQDFTLTAIGTVLYNVGLILGLIPGIIQTFHTTSSQPTDLAIYSATFGVVLAAVLQIGVQVPGLFKQKMRYTFSFDWRHPGVIQIARQMVPRIINSVMLTFSTTVDRFLLSLLITVVAAKALDGLITEYFQAFSILVLPVSIFASSAATAAFPTLANYVTRGRVERVRTIIMETLRSILFLTIPSAIGLIVLALPVIQVLLEHGNFTLGEAQFAAIALAFFAIGLPGLAAVEILTRSFYAYQDSRTPVIISVAQFILKIALSIILINLATYGAQWGMGALALSTSVASTLEAVVLFILLYQRIGNLGVRSLFGFFGRVAVAGIIMALVLLLLRAGLDRMIDTTTATKLYVPGILQAVVKLLIELGAGTLVFLVVARLLRMDELNHGMVRRVLNRLHVPWL